MPVSPAVPAFRQDGRLAQRSGETVHLYIDPAEPAFRQNPDAPHDSPPPVRGVQDVPAAIHGLHQHFGGVHIVLQIGKDKQTALRPGKALHALHLLQRAEHAVQLRAIAGADLLHVGTQQVAAQISIHDSLVEVGRVQIV